MNIERLAAVARRLDEALFDLARVIAVVVDRGELNKRLARFGLQVVDLAPPFDPSASKPVIEYRRRGRS